MGEDQQSVQIKIGDRMYTMEELEELGYGFDDGSVEDTDAPEDDDVVITPEPEPKKTLPKRELPKKEATKALPKSTTLPKQYEDAMPLLTKVEQFLEDNHLFDVYNHDDCDSFCNEHGYDLKKSQYNKLKRLVEAFDMVSNDIADIDEGVRTKAQVKQATSKVNKIKKLAADFI